MEVPFRSSPALRNNVCNSTAELGSYGTQKLPDGATVYVVGNDAFYRLYKGVGTIWDAFAGLVINPHDGSNNRWLQESENGASPWQATEIASAGVNVTPGAQFAWQALGSTAGSFTLASGNGDVFAVNLTTSLLTYNGPTRLFNVTYQASVLAGAVATFDAQAAISVSGDISVGNTSDQLTKGQQASTVNNSSMQCITGQRQALLGSDDTVRLFFRNMSGTTAIQVQYCSINIRP